MSAYTTSGSIQSGPTEPTSVTHDKYCRQRPEIDSASWVVRSSFVLVTQCTDMMALIIKSKIIIKIANASWYYFNNDNKKHQLAMSKGQDETEWSAIAS